MDPHWTWVFARNGQRLEIIRLETETECGLTIEDGQGTPRHYRFDDMVTLVNFQGDMEEFLLKPAGRSSSSAPSAGRSRSGAPGRGCGTGGAGGPTASQSRRGSGCSPVNQP